MQTKFNPKEKVENIKINADYYRSEFEKINRLYEKLLSRQTYEREHEIESGPYATEYQIRHIGCHRNRLMRFMMIHGIAFKIERKEKEPKMEDYKLRMVKEYKELKNKYDKLYAMLVKYDAGKLDFTPTCPIDLLRKQASVMGQYLYILETRAVIEDVDLNTEI